VIRSVRSLRSLRSLCFLAIALPLGAQARPVALRSAPITDVRYTLNFTAGLGVERSVEVGMTFAVSGRDPVVLSMPVWTPGSYEVNNWARYLSDFHATAKGKALRWDKSDPDTWRIYSDAPGEVKLQYRLKADTLDNAGNWARDEFALVNGTAAFLYPEGRPLEFPSQVTVTTEPAWRVVTGLPATGARTFTAPTYHELVDHPFFIGRFDVDSALVAGVWFRLSAYPEGSTTVGQRAKLLDQMKRVIPKQTQVFGDTPWRRYEIMQIAEKGFGGMSALEHENSNVALVEAEALDEDFVPSVYAHEIFHAFNVKRLRPIDLWPYRYEAAQPTPWLWVSEGITDYYADLSLLRGGVWKEPDFLGATQKKLEHLEATVPVALEDASLQTWLHMTDGTSDIYYDKGSLAGLALDILIRDATDNAGSLDDVFRELYANDFRQGRGFTPEEWWGAVSRAAKGLTFTDFANRYVDGRDSYPIESWLAKAGWRIRADSTREARFGVSLSTDSLGVRVGMVDPNGAAAAGGVKANDLLTAVDGVSTGDPSWQRWRQKYSAREGAKVSVELLRDGTRLVVQVPVRISVLIERRIEPDPKASAKAQRVRQGILRGETNRDTNRR
jgi:predicted metalloprotease with PDZ domain